MNDSTQVLQVAAEAAKSAPPDITLMGICGLLGIAFHFGKKAKRLQANAQFEPGAFWKAEYLSIGLSMITLILALICRENIAGLKIGSYVIGIYIYPTFFGIGYIGDSLVDWVIGGYEKQLKKLTHGQKD